MKKLVFFDFDGVLVDTLNVAYSINIEVNDDLSLDEYISFFEGNIHHRPLRSNGQHKNYHPDFYALYDHRSRELMIPEILKKILKELSEKYILVVISGTHTNSILKILDREGVRDLFKDILGPNVHTSKVSKIKMMLDKYGLLPEETAFVTDTNGDVREASECGVNSVAVTWGYHDHERLKKSQPAKIISNPLDLPKAIEEI